MSPPYGRQLAGVFFDGLVGYRSLDGHYANRPVPFICPRCPPCLGGWHGPVPDRLLQSGLLPDKPGPQLNVR